MIFTLTNLLFVDVASVNVMLERPRKRLADNFVNVTTLAAIDMMDRFVPVQIMEHVLVENVYAKMDGKVPIVVVK